MALLNEAQKKVVAEAVARAEAGTSGELVVAQVKSSDNYALPRALVALGLAALVAELSHLGWPDLVGEFLVPLQAALCVAVYLLTGAGPILRLIISARIREEQVMDAAQRAFISLGVTETRARSGVLLFLSEVEHRVVILADKGINERVDKGEWDTDVDTLVQALRRGDPEGGLLQVIERIGGLLSASFPRGSDDRNELSDSVRQG